MKKSHGFIFLILGVLLLVVYVLYSKTDIFKGKTNDVEEPSVVTEDIKYDYVKSYDVNSKTKISFPIFDNLKVDPQYTEDYGKKYSNENDIYYSVIVKKSDLSLNEYILNQSGSILELYDGNERTIVTDDVECSNLCKRYQVMDGEKLLADYLEIYIKSSSSDITEISYHVLNNKISNDVIKTLVNHIKLSSDAVYTVGTIDGSNLNLLLDLGNNKKITVSLDSNVYEEVVDEYNTNRRTMIKNKNTNATFAIKGIPKLSNKTMLESVDIYEYSPDPGSNRNEIVVGDKTFYSYPLDGITDYSYIVDSDSAILIQETK